MREKWQRQMPLMPEIASHIQARELEVISSILDSKPIITEFVLQDLCKRRHIVSRAGAKGMSAEQVLRAAVVMRLYGLTYQDLAFHLVDSQSIRRFCRIGIAAKGFKKSVLNKNIKALSERTWEAINLQLLDYAKEKKIEKGRVARIDCTVVESNIHEPSDSGLLYDCVRVLSRLQERLQGLGLGRFGYHNHQRVAKRRMVKIHYARSKDERRGAYVDLLKYTEKSLASARRAIERLKTVGADNQSALGLFFELERYVALTEKVIAQTERRVIKGEKVPASEKLVSIFEEHTDIIVKDRRDTFFGHKICLTGGRSNLILDCQIVEGNPADATLTRTMLDRQEKIYGRCPLKVALDGAFASKANLKAAKDRGIKDVCFAKKRGLDPQKMCRSQYVYKKLRRFRAGIEAGISWLKRSLGLDRCTWKGWQSFQSYVWASIVSANLLTIARKQLA
jgi:transposase, IS5 family